MNCNLFHINLLHNYVILYDKYQVSVFFIKEQVPYLLFWKDQLASMALDFFLAAFKRY